MFQSVKYNLLIPFQYDSEQNDKLPEDRCDLCKEKVEACREKGMDSKIWFQKCFRMKPLENNEQKKGSPLLEDDRYKIIRMELDSPVRSILGISNKEQTTYTMDKIRINFKMPKIRLLFTRNKIGFIHIEIITFNLNEEESRKFGYTLSKLERKQTQISYQKKIAKDESKTITISFKQLIENIVNLQTYIPMSLYNNRILSYLQVAVIGSCEKEDKLKYFNSLQALSQRPSTRNIEESQIYWGKEDYVSRFSGDKTACIYGDTAICGEENLEFLTNVENGLVKTATENYTTVFAFLVSLRLLLADPAMKETDFQYLSDAPENLSEEENITKFFEKCIWKDGWKLTEQLAILKEKVKMEQEERDRADRERQSKEQGETLKKMAEDMAEVREGTRYIAEFVKNELSSFLRSEKVHFNQLQDKDKDESIGSFVRKTSEQIDQKLVDSKNQDIDEERRKLEALFGERWQYVMKSSQTSLVSSAVLLSRCSDIAAPDFDWSGVCICCTAALEAELKRVFFDGLLDFMADNYGEPSNENADEIYKFWPEELLSIPKYQFLKRTDSTLKRVKLFTMGKLPFLFGETGEFSSKQFIRQSQLAQSELMRKRMTEYLSTIVLDYYKEIPFEAFYIGKKTDDRLTSQAGCFVWKCEQIRNKYRNKAAHVNVMTEQEATSCYQSILTKRGTYTYNAEIAGTILELFSKIDGSKLSK